MSEVASQIVDQIQAVPAPVENTTPAEAKPDDKLASRLEVMIKREQQARAREDSAKAYEAKIQDKLKLIEEFELAKGGNAKKALELLGLNYDQLSQAILRDGELPPEVGLKKLEDKLNSFEKNQEQARLNQEEDNKKRAQEQEAKAISDFKTEITQYLSDNKTRYELIDFEGQQELVFEVVDEHYNRTLNSETGVGKVMSISEAADKVEEFLEKKYDKAKQVNKIKTLWGSIPKSVQVEMQKPQSSRPKTLTNTLSASSERPRTSPVTDEERVQKAIAYGKQFLKG